MPLHTEDPWHQAMRQGDFARAWRISDRVLARRLLRQEPQHHLPRHLQGVWSGESLACKHVLVRCYHGLGDTVQYIRFARRLRAVAREVSVWVQPPLLSLAASAAGVDRVLPLHDGSPDLDVDVDIEMMELAHALRITPNDLPGAVPYLSAGVPACRQRPRKPFTVGVVWSGGDWDSRRSMTLHDLWPALDVPEIRFVSFQRGAAARQCTLAGIADEGSDNVDIFARRLLDVDLLLSVDTFAAHLAGALGVPVWLMLHSACDWRWMEATDATIWYPTMRLFRQRRAGQWRDVVEDVAQALAARKPGTKQSTSRSPQDEHTSVRK